MKLSTSLLRLVMVPVTNVTFLKSRILVAFFSFVLKLSSLSKSLDELSKEFHQSGP